MSAQHTPGPMVPVTFYDGHRTAPVQIELTQEEADFVGFLSEIARRPERNPGDSKRAARLEWDAWAKQSPDSKAEVRRYAVLSAMQLSDAAIAKATGSAA